MMGDGNRVADGSDLVEVVGGRSFVGRVIGSRVEDVSVGLNDLVDRYFDIDKDRSCCTMASVRDDL
jgi:hypothetical protein